MKNIVSSQENFVVKIIGNQHSTWQGTVTWMEENRTQPFRSALELIKLIDSAIENRPTAAKAPVEKTG